MTAGPDPQHPDSQAFERAAALVDVDLSGGRSTVANAPVGFTTEKASRLKAVLAATSSPAPSTSSKSLLEAYNAWRKQRAAAEATSKGNATTAEDVEAKALRKSRKKLKKCMGGGISVPVSVATAHAHYRKHGGKSTLPVWSRKVTSL